MLEKTEWVSEFADYAKFSDIKIEVFAPDWYYRGKFDLYPEHSNKILNSKDNDRNHSEYFIPKMISLVKQMRDHNKLSKIDLVAIIPSSDLGYKQTLDSTAKAVAEHLCTKYEKIIARIKPGRRNLYCTGVEERFKQTKDSMKLTRELSPVEKTILIIDDVKVTGATILEVASLFKKAGATKIHAICFGISKNVNYKMS